MGSLLMNLKECDALKEAFCTALAECGIVTQAARDAGITRQTAYKWREHDPEFAAAWDKALKIGIDALEDEAHRRAFIGVDKPVFYKGTECGTVREYSDMLTVFLLKAHRPEKFRENSRMELTGANGGPVELNDTERAARIATLVNAAKQRAAAQAQAEGTPPEDGSDLV